MASRVEGEQLQGFDCPMCLDVFKDPTILSCGHTFCKGCLEAYDDQHNLDHIVCPVCRQITELGQRRIAGLTQNFLAVGIQDELNVALPSPSFCPLHCQIHNDIFCEVCKKFICLTCYLDNHRDHSIKKKEELEGHFERKTETLIQMSNTRKTEFEKRVDNAEKQKIEMHCHFSKVEKEIKDEFAKRVSILQEHEEKLLKSLHSIRKDTENQLEGFIANHRQVIDQINNSNTILRGDIGNNLDSDTIQAQHLHCSDLENSLKKIIGEESIVRLKETVESTRFRPSDERLLALGHIERDGKITINIQSERTAAGANKKAQQVESSRREAVFPALVENKSLNIVRKIDAPRIFGMSALSQDAVVVGYGVERLGSECFSVSGEKTQHLKSEVGEVYDIAVLTDGKSVVSHDRDIFSVYTTQNTHSTDITYRCNKGKSIIKMCVDQHDNIYAINGNPEIYIFHGSNPNPRRVVSTGDIKPRQICISQTGVMITSTCYTASSTVTVFDRDGHVGSSITANDDYLYAAVDSQDSLLIAWVKWASDVFRLTRYTLQGTTLIEEVVFKELKLPCAIAKLSPYCYMTSLTPKLIAFANSTRMYFIELPE